jgi:hemoglobin
MFHRTTRLIVAAIVVLGMGSAAVAKSKGSPTLYDQLGKKKGITKVVNDFITKVGGDDRINHFFKDDIADSKRMAKLKKNIVNQICQASGGPCKYTGKDMKTTHQGMGITDADFNAFVEDLKATLDADNVSQDAQNQLLGVLGPMKSDIVEK